MAAEILLDDGGYIPPQFGSMATGLVVRDMQSFPVGGFAPPAEVPLIPRKDWISLARERTEKKVGLRAVRKTGMDGEWMPSLNQNDPRRPRHWGYCWYYASVTALMLLRAKMNQPYVKLSAFGGAATIKNLQNDGGWGAQSLESIENVGVGPESLWPEFETKLRKPDDPFWVEAANYKFTDGFAELEAPVYDRDLSEDQFWSLLFQDIPVIGDYMDIGHCMCAYDVEERNGVLVAVCMNTWGDESSKDGEVLRSGRKAIPDNAVAPTGALAS